MPVNTSVSRQAAKLGVFPSAAELPNVAGAAIQTNNLQAGDTAWVEGGALESGFYICIDPTVDFAIWELRFRKPGGSLVVLDSANGAGDIAWQYVMGMMFRVLQASDLTEIWAKLGASGVGVGHAWTLRRSTVVSPSQPALATFTDVVASGVHTPATTDWEAVGYPGPLSVTPDQWYVSTLYIGTGGQSASLTALRSGGQTSETLASIAGGVFFFTGAVAVPGPNPNPIPTSGPIATTLYGMITPELEIP